MNRFHSNPANKTVAVAEPFASQRFRFRFVARGDRANELVALAVKSLARCHPRAGMIVVDANDTPTLRADIFGAVNDLQIVHVRPSDDPVARAVGRGTRQHMFYWRHSPQLRGQLPSCDRYDVHADGDLLFLRPMDLAALLRPMAQGRIAAAIDESTLDHYGALGIIASTLLADMLPAAGSGGPLLQTGLIFSNPADDGALYDRFWDFALAAAASGHLEQLPSDDMCIVAALLGQGGPLWERLLPLGHEWNYITDAVKDPGIFGCAAHYGGHRAKTFILAQTGTLFPPGDDAQVAPWGTVTSPNGAPESALFRGPWQRRLSPHSIDNSISTPLSIPLPFALSWPVPREMTRVDISGVLDGPGSHTGIGDDRANLFVYADGRLVQRLLAEDRRVQATVHLGHAETVTVIGTTTFPECVLHLDGPFNHDTSTWSGATLSLEEQVADRMEISP